MDSRLQKSTQHVLVKTAKRRESKKNTLKTQQKQSQGAKKREALFNFNHAWMTGGTKRTALNWGLRSIVILRYLHETWHTYSPCSWLQNPASDFLIFAQGLSYGLSKSKKRGKIITKFWKTITKSWSKNLKTWGNACRSALLRSFCENRFRLSQLVKKLNSTERGALFRHFCVSKVITTAHAHKSGVIFYFFQELSNKKKLRRHNQRWQK